MGLQLDSEVDTTGLTANHYEVIELRIIAADKTAYVVVGLWKDKASKTAGKFPVLKLNYIWPKSESPFTNQQLADLATSIYTKLKTLSEFTGAIDD